MHIYRSNEGPRVEPPGHFGHLEVSDIATAEQNFGAKAQLSFCPPGGGGEMHHHENEDQLFIVVEGELTFNTGTEEFTLNQNEAVLFHAGDPHHTINQSAAPSISVVLTVPTS